MWRLLRDQIERSKWLLLVSALTASSAALLGPMLGPLRSQSTDDLGRVFVRLFITTFPLFMAASMGYLGTLADPRHGNARTIRILPLPRDDLARAIWLGTAMPGIIIGTLVCALVTLLHFVLGLEHSRAVLFDSLAATALTATLGSSMSVVMWSYLAVTTQLPETVRRLAGVLLFHQLWYLAWLAAARRFGTLAPESLLVVLFGVAAAGSCLLLSTRLWTTLVTLRPRASAGSGRDVSIYFPRQRGRDSNLVSLAFRAAALAFGFAFLLNIGFRLAIAVHRPLAEYFSFPFRLRWMVLVTYAVVWIWFSSWRAALRTLRCLPISGMKLIVVSIGAFCLIYLGGSLGALSSLAFEHEQTRLALAELPFIALLALGTSLCLAGMALHVRRPMGLHHLFGLGFLVLPNAMFLPIALGDGTWLVGFTSRVWLWSYSAPAAILLTALGALAIARGLALSGTPYRPTPLADRGV